MVNCKTSAISTTKRLNLVSKTAKELFNFENNLDFCKSMNYLAKLINMKDKYIYLPLLLAFAVGIFLFSLRNQSPSYRLHSLMKKGAVDKQQFIDSIEFVMENGAIVVEIKHEKANFAKNYRFIFETGSPTYFSKELLLEAALVEKLEVQNNNGQSKAVSFFLTHLQIRDINFGSVGVGELQTLPPNIDGIIGANLMQHCLWQIDYPKRKIYFASHQDFLPKQPKMHQVSFIRNIYRIPCIYLTINNFPRRPMAWVSTSKKTTVLLDQQFSNLRYAMAFPQDSATAERLAIGTLEVQKIPTTFSLGQQCYLGSEFLKNYVLTFDWSSRKMYIGQ